MSDSQAERASRIKEGIQSFPDFPKAGIKFWDVFSLTKKPALFNDCIALMLEHIIERHPQVDVIVALESRGFLFGPSIAQQLQIPFVPIRKAGKLPGKTVSVSYSLEYGKDCVEIQMDAIQAGQKVIIVDDLLATGGTLKASCELINKLNAIILECLVLIDLPELNGRKLVPVDVHSLITL